MPTQVKTEAFVIAKLTVSNKMLIQSGVSQLTAVKTDRPRAAYAQ